MHIFQAHGKFAYVMKAVAFSDPSLMKSEKELMIFWAAEHVNIYLIDIGRLDDE